MNEQRVRVERFEELRVGMRVLVEPCSWCGRRDVGVLGHFESNVTGQLANGAWSTQPAFLLIDGCERLSWVTPTAVRPGLVYRFASDLGIDDQLAAENDNPYLARDVVGTGGRDEVLIAAKERGR